MTTTDGPWADVSFGLGELYELEGDLAQAAEWYREAAESGRADAALRLGDVLGRLADERLPAAPDTAEELLAEATRWLSGAPAASSPDAIELITEMLDRHHRWAARRGLEPGPAS
ncbi:tetratricopeptide repeat protein [Actinomadura kijaniata]|uniref:tetratricopeptide repeat protein n=1 Tax=Actinomadura kijaniata TaxID=46161 RepID=UPI003F19586E